MIDAFQSCSLRVRSYHDVVRDADRTFRLAAGVDVRAAMKRAALAAGPKIAGWALRLFTIERTAEGKRIVLTLDGVACRGRGGPDYATALVATLDGGFAVLAVPARDAGRVEGISSGISRTGR